MPRSRKYQVRRIGDDVIVVTEPTRGLLPTMVEKAIEMSGTSNGGVVTDPAHFDWRVHKTGPVRVGIDRDGEPVEWRYCVVACPRKKPRES